MSINKNKILILGHKGFFGSNLLNKLKTQNYNVCQLSYNLNLHNFEKSLKEIKKINPDLIINCAGKVGGLHYNISKKTEIFYCNIKILINVLEISSRLNIKRLINIGSSCSYPKNLKSNKLSENNLFKGELHETVEPYGFWKLASIIGSRAYYFDKKIISQNIIFPSLYGPGDKFDALNSHVISSLIKKFDKAKKNKINSVILWGNGKPKREFMYIDDAVEGIKKVITRYKLIDPINLGQGKGHSIKEIAIILKKIFNYNGKIIWDKSMPNGAMSKILDVKKQDKLLKWGPNVSLENGLAKTVDWYLKNDYS